MWTRELDTQCALFKRHATAIYQWDQQIRENRSTLVGVQVSAHSPTVEPPPLWPGSSTLICLASKRSSPAHAYVPRCTCLVALVVVSWTEVLVLCVGAWSRPMWRAWGSSRRRWKGSWSSLRRTRKRFGERPCPCAHMAPWAPSPCAWPHVFVAPPFEVLPFELLPPVGLLFKVLPFVWHPIVLAP